MMQQARQILEWAIIKAPTCKLFSEYYYDGKGCRTRWNIPKHGMAEA